MKLTLSHYTNSHGEREHTVLVDGRAMMAATTQEARARKMAFDLYTTFRVPCGLSEWDGDTGAETELTLARLLDVPEDTTRCRDCGGTFEHCHCPHPFGVYPEVTK